jgi:hydrogenase maturation protease
VRADCSVGGLEVLELLAGYARAIIIDSMQTAGGVPGRWHAFDGDALRDTMHLTNVHDANFATALELGRRLGMPLPPASRIHIFAVEVKDTITFAERMTPVLEEGLAMLADAIFSEVCQLLALPAPSPRARPLPKCEPLARISS